MSGIEGKEGLSDRLINSAFDFYLRLPNWVGQVFLIVVIALEFEAIVAARSSKAFVLVLLLGLVSVAVLTMFITMFLTAQLAKESSHWRLLELQRTMSDVRKLPWPEFEALVGELFEALGYRVETRGGRGPDGGIDLILHRGGKRSIVQCKQWYRWWTGVDKVRELLGTVVAERAEEGILVTSGIFSDDALSFGRGKTALRLIDGQQLWKMMQETKPLTSTPRPLAAAPDGTIAGPACPWCPAPMVVSGEPPSWGCPHWPDCKGWRRARAAEWMWRPHLAVC